jgi:hypothetical protein
LTQALGNICRQPKKHHSDTQFAFMKHGFSQFYFPIP